MSKNSFIGRIANVIESEKNGSNALLGAMTDVEILDSTKMLVAIHDYYNEVIPDSKRGQSVEKLVSEIENQIGKARYYMKLYWAKKDPTIIAYSKNPYLAVLNGEGSLEIALTAYRQAALEITILNSAVQNYGGERMIRHYIRLNEKRINVNNAEDVLRCVSDWITACDEFSELDSFRAMKLA